MQRRSVLTLMYWGVYERVCHRGDEFSRDPKVAEFDLPFAVAEDIGRLDVYQG
jgi:hypothetical protein